MVVSTYTVKLFGADVPGAVQRVTGQGVRAFGEKRPPKFEGK
jgi:hypothetical protein